MEETVVIPSNLDAAQEAGDKLLDQLAKHAFPEAAIFAIKLALEEALNNAVKHGNKFDAEKTVGMTWRVDAAEVAVTITDQGEGFKPDRLPDPTADENIEKPTGRGVMLMRAFMDEVRFNERGNQVTMVKKNG